jgi:hypothetical protein
VSLESMLLAGAAFIATGLVILGAVFAYWSTHRFGPIVNVLPAVLGTSLIAIGTQNAFGGFLLSIIGGNEADFLKLPPRSQPTSAEILVATSDRPPQTD